MARGRFRRARRLTAAVLGAAAVTGLGAGAAQAQAPAPAKPVDLDVLFIGAHPDDEAGGLAVYGAWAEEYGKRTGVVTITRGEGGGNAVGPEEGPPLGLLREAEERRAVGRAGVGNVYNLDEVDFYYTVSATLTDEVWNARETLERVVRVVRRTRPDVIVTMNPSPTPGNHGHHQQAARLAVQAFEAAADPSAFRSQITQERLRPWRVKRIFRFGATGTGPTGSQCVSTFTPTEPTDETFALWGGERSAAGVTWAQVEREAQREYRSQGWAVFPDIPTDPAQIGCDRMTQIDSRVPYTAQSTRRDAALEGAVVTPETGLPLGTELYLTADRFDLAPGREVKLTVHARGPRELGAATVRLDLPEGFTGDTTAELGRLRPNRESTVSLRVTAPTTLAATRRVRVRAIMRANGREGSTSEVLRLVPAVRGTLEALPEVADFRAWTREANAPQLDNLVFPLASIAQSQTRTLRVDLENYGQRAQGGTVELRLPPGFTADAARKAFAALSPGGRGSVTFAVTNTDPSLKTANEGGDYPVEIVTSAGGGQSVERAALNLVPRTTIPQAPREPELDGVEAPGEYPGATLDLSRRWEGTVPSSAADASGSAKVAWGPDALYLFVNVADEALGTVLPESDAKRHWRTDSVEVLIDPAGNSANTSTTFKVGVFPTTLEGRPAAYRDADNRQGPVAETAPGMRVASRVRAPYDGYTLEMKIAFADLPAAVDPARMGLNVFIYDSDTQDRTGQTRLAWSPYGGVQGDPYRWGQAAFDGPLGTVGPAEPREPIFPREAARSVLSPLSIRQSAEDGVALAGGPQAAERARIVGLPRYTSGAVLVTLEAGGPGTAYVFVTDAGGEQVAAALGLGSATVTVPAAGRYEVRVPIPVPDRGQARRVAMAFEAAAGGTRSDVARIEGRP